MTRIVCWALAVLVAGPVGARAADGSIAPISIADQAARQARRPEALNQLTQAPRSTRGRRIRGGLPIVVGAGVGCGSLSALTYAISDGGSRGLDAAKGCLGGALIGAAFGYLFATRP